MIDMQLGTALAFLAYGLVALAFGIPARLRKLSLIRRAVSVQSRVVAVKAVEFNDDGLFVSHYPTVEFQAAGVTVRAEVIIGRLSPEDVAEGKELHVYFDPNDPTRVVLKPSDWPGGGCLTVTGGISAILGAALLIAYAAGVE